MKTVCNKIKCLKHCKSGLAATEFAILLPVMVVLFFGLIEASDAMTVNRKVAISTNTLADLAAQSEQIETDQIGDLFNGVLSIIEPSSPTGLQLRLVSVVPDADDKPIVHWSRDYAGGSPYTAGADYTELRDDTVLPPGGSLIVVEMSYTYTPALTSHILSSPIVFDRKSIRMPRLASRVQLCDANGDNCTS